MVPMHTNRNPGHAIVPRIPRRTSRRLAIMMMIQINPSSHPPDSIYLISRVLPALFSSRVLEGG